MPNLQDVQTRGRGLALVSADLEGVYVDESLFGSQLELHSSQGTSGCTGACQDWPPRESGECLACSDDVRLSTRLELFVLIVGMWELLFSPISSNLPHVVLARALALPVKGAATAARDLESSTAS